MARGEISSRAAAAAAVLLAGSIEGTAPRPGQTPQAEQLNPSVAYRVSNAPAEEQFFMGGAGIEHYDVYTNPIRTRYSEVYWINMPPVDLPKAMVEKYDGKAMVLVGHEVDVVRRDNATGTETSVPCYESYNHHFTASLRSKHVELVGTPESDVSVQHRHHTNGTHIFRYQLKAGHESQLLAGIPTSTETQNPNNGNEHRQSYHMLPEGLVKPIQSPTQFDFTPMQIVK